MWFLWLALNSPGIMSSRHIHAVACVAAPLPNISKHGDHQEDSLTITSSYRVVLFFFLFLCFETRASLPSPCWPGTLSPPSLAPQGLGSTPGSCSQIYGIKGYKAEWAEGEMADGLKSRGRQASPRGQQCAVNIASEGTSRVMPCLGFF